MPQPGPGCWKADATGGAGSQPRADSAPHVRREGRPRETTWPRANLPWTPDLRESPAEVSPGQPRPGNSPHQPAAP